MRYMLKKLWMFILRDIVSKCLTKKAESLLQRSGFKKIEM